MYKTLGLAITLINIVNLKTWSWLGWYIEFSRT